VSLEAIGNLVQRARGADGATPEPGSERARLMRVAAEFESMLMLQMLKEMRKAGSWDDRESEKSGYGAATMLETIDVELAGHLAKAQGLGLGKQLMEAFEKMEMGAASDTIAPAALAPSLTMPAALAEPLSTNVEPLGVPAGKVTSGFGWRQDPLHGAARFHRGIDIRAAYGQDIPAAGPGRVVSAGTEGGYGQTVVIEHAGGVRTRYAHLSTTLVAAGDEVTDGSIVGRAGRSGRTTGTHLHFEVLTASGKPMNPEEFAGLKADGIVADLTRGTYLGLQETRSDDNTN